MRWMKLEAQPYVPSLYFLLFSWNKIKINNFLSVIWLSAQYKNTSKIKVLQMPWKLNMIFSRIFEDLWNWEHTRGVNHLPTRVQGTPTPLGCAPCLVGPRWPSSTYSYTHTLHLPPTNTNNQLKPEPKLVLLSFSISLLKAPLTKLLGEIVPGYVTPPLVQLVFVLVLYSLQICVA